MWLFFSNFPLISLKTTSYYVNYRFRSTVIVSISLNFLGRTSFSPPQIGTNFLFPWASHALFLYYSPISLATPNVHPWNFSQFLPKFFRPQGEIFSGLISIKCEKPGQPAFDVHAEVNPLHHFETGWKIRKFTRWTHGGCDGKLNKQRKWWLMTKEAQFYERKPPSR